MLIYRIINIIISKPKICVCMCNICEFIRLTEAIMLSNAYDLMVFTFSCLHQDYCYSQQANNMLLPGINKLS